MKDREFENLLRFKVKYDALIPDNDKAKDYVLQNDRMEVYLLPQTPRDIKFHACYFALVTYIWNIMPEKFKKYKCPNQFDMDKFMKVVCGQYELAMNYKGKDFYSFESISFAKMNEEKFREYVSEQLSMFYTEILVPLGKENLMDDINNEFESFISKLI